jgi:polyribonucleotide nucleotidyltransferase
MELKLKGIPLDLLDKIFETSKTARLKVLDVMNAVIASPRGHISEFAPKLEVIKIQKDEIGAMIGSGGANIKGLMEMFNVEINVDEKDGEGIVAISSKSSEDIAKAKQYIMDMFREVKTGEEYTGKVTRVEDYGAFVEILPKQEGLLHVSEYSYDFVNNIRDFLDIGDMVKVKVKGLENGKISLTRKGLFENPNPNKVQIQTNRPVNKPSGGFRPGARRFDNRSTNVNPDGRAGRESRSRDNNRGRSDYRRDEDRRPPRPVSNG